MFDWNGNVAAPWEVGDNWWDILFILWVIEYYKITNKINRNVGKNYLFKIIMIIKPVLWCSQRLCESHFRTFLYIYNSYRPTIANHFSPKTKNARQEVIIFICYRRKQVVGELSTTARCRGPLYIVLEGFEGHCAIIEYVYSIYIHSGGAEYLQLRIYSTDKCVLWFGRIKGVVAASWFGVCATRQHWRKCVLSGAKECASPHF